MSTRNLSPPTSRQYPWSRWGQVKLQVAEWRGRVRLRHELMNLSDRTLRDIGLSRCDAGYQASKPFWVP